MAAKAQAHFGVAVAAVKSHAHAARRAVMHGDAKLPFLFQFLALLLVEQALRHGVQILLRQRVLVGQNDFAVDAKAGGTPATRCRSDASYSLTADKSRSRCEVLIS
jgi:hypothetical protein